MIAEKTQERATRPLVHVVDDDPSVLESLCWLLESEGLEVTRNRTAGELLSRPTDELNPHGNACVVTDLAMPGLDGLELHEELTRRGTPLPTLVVTGQGDVPTAVRAMQAGCAGFLQKPYGEDDLLDTVRAMGREGGGGGLHRVEVQDRLTTLTVRENEVLLRVVHGHSNREIAADLDLSPKTVEAHRSRLMEKMRAGSLPELVRMAVLVGL